MSKQRFRLVEQPSPERADEPIERDLLSVSEFHRPAGKGAGWLDNEAGAKRFAQLFIEAETAHPNERIFKQASFQNRVLRAVYNGDIESPMLFVKEMSRQLLSLDSSKNYTADARTVLVGVNAAMKAIASEIKGFERTPHPVERQQEILLNDYLDTRKSIDYIDLRYDTDEQGNVTRIAEIRLVQVKAGEIDQDEIEKIHLAHDRYLDELLDRESFIRREQVKASEQHVVSGEKIRREMEAKEFSGERLEYLLDLLDPILSRVAELKGGVLSTKQMQEWGKDQPEILPLLAILLRQPEASVQIKALLEFFTTSNQVDLVFQQLRDWAEGYQISSQEYADLYPEWSVPPDILDATTFVSVIRHKNSLIETPIFGTQRGAKVVTHR